jgi:hypothetical protein
LCAGGWSDKGKFVKILFPRWFQLQFPSHFCVAGLTPWGKCGFDVFFVGVMP